MSYVVISDVTTDLPVDVIDKHNLIIMPILKKKI